jgi:hypothetical protein
MNSSIFIHEGPSGSLCGVDDGRPGAEWPFGNGEEGKSVTDDVAKSDGALTIPNAE